MATLYKLIRPFAMMLPPEAAHRLSLGFLKLLCGSPRRKVDDPILEIECLGLSFRTPIGVAAGYDKNAEVPEALFNTGFSFVEVGTVTPKPQPGNPKPRIFRLKKDRAVINRLGFNNQGSAAAAKRLRAFPPGKRPGPLGINIGANKDAKDRIDDYLTGVETFFDVADYLTINISSPNTPGLRDLQGKASLETLLKKLTEKIKGLGEKAGRAPPPLFVKIAPDLETAALRDVVSIAIKFKIGGLIVSNTTTARPRTLKSSHKGEEGGLSGQPLFDPSTKCLEEAYRLGKGKLVLIGVGGIETPDQVYEKILKGASLVQIYTGLIYEGAGLPKRLAKGLAERLREDGFSSLSEAVGRDVK